MTETKEHTSLEGAPLPVATLGDPGEDDLYEAILSVFPDVCVFAFDHELRYLYAAGTVLGRLGWRAEDVLGRRPSDVLGEDEGTHLEERLVAALAGERRYFEQAGTTMAGSVWATTVSPRLEASGRVVGAMVVARDIGELRQTELARDAIEQVAVAHAQRARFEHWRRERMEFLVEVNDVVADCADRRDVMRAVANAAVPRLGDWCSIYVLLDPQDRVPAVEVAHADPVMASYARELIERFPYDPDAALGVANVLRSGRAEFHPDITDDVLATLELPGEAVDVVHQLALRSSITVPLVKRRRVIGAMQFVLSGPERRYTHDDLTLAQALAGRVASSIDNHRLAEAQRDIAQTLQRNLLPGALPEVPGADLAVRCWATGEATEMGGDFYDVFAIDGTSHAIVVGDVCGKGPSAAASTALVRHTVRANAWRGDVHLSVLEHLNAALLRAEPSTLCTVAYATITGTAEGLRLVVAAAGHPLPVLVRADGTAEYVGDHGLLLGAFEDIVATTAAVDLLPGDTVAFYTDGATDVRPPNDLSPEDMRKLLADVVPSSPTAEEAVARVFDVLGDVKPFDQREDDVALVVVRAVPGTPARA